MKRKRNWESKMYKILGTKKKKKTLFKWIILPVILYKERLRGFFFQNIEIYQTFFFLFCLLISQNIVLHAIIHSLSYIIHTIIVDSHHAFILLRKGKIKRQRTNIKKTLNPLIYRLNFIEVFIIRTLWIYMDM